MARPPTLRRLRGISEERPRLAASIAISAATFVGFVGVGCVLPVLPRYVKGPVGAGDVAVGVVMGIFALTAFFGRPIGGRIADRTGRRIVVVGGLLMCGAAGLMYLIPLGVPGLLAARLVLGLGDAWVYVAGVAWIIDLAPEERRGQAIALFGTAVWGGTAIGPLVGQLVLDHGSYDAVFLVAGALPLIGAVIARRVPDSRPAVVPGRRPKQRLVPRPVLAPGLVLGMSNIGYGITISFIVLLLVDRGIGHGALVFACFAGAVVTSRLLAGSVPDRLGAHRAAVGAAAFEAAGLAVLAFAQTLPVAIVGAALTGMGFSLLFPALALIVIDKTPSDQRGAALGSFTAFVDIGVGVGAPLGGLVAALGGYEATFLFAAGAATLGVIGALLLARPARGAEHEPLAAPPALGAHALAARSSVSRARLSGVGMPWRAPAATTAPVIASCSSRRPARRSNSIDVPACGGKARKTSSLAAMSPSSSRAPAARATATPSRMIAAASSSTSSRCMTSPRRPLSAVIGLAARFPRSLRQLAVRKSGSSMTCRPLPSSSAAKRAPAGPAGTTSSSPFGWRTCPGSTSSA
jgi:MFS family permease